MVDFTVNQKVTMKDLQTGFDMVGWQWYQRAAELWEDDECKPSRQMGIVTPQKKIGGKTGTMDAVGTPWRSPQHLGNTPAEASEDSAPEMVLPKKTPPQGEGKPSKRKLP